MFWPQANSTSLRDKKPNEPIAIAIIISRTTSNATPRLSVFMFLHFILIIITHNITILVEQIARPAAKRCADLIPVNDIVLNDVKRDTH